MMNHLYKYNKYLSYKQYKNQTLSIYHYYIRFAYKTSMKYVNNLYFSQSNVKYTHMTSLYVPYYFKVKSIFQRLSTIDSLYSIKNIPSQSTLITLNDITRLSNTQSNDFQDYDINYSNFHFFYLNNLISSINSDPMVFLAHSNFKVLNKNVYYKSTRRKLDFKDKTYVIKITRNITRKIKKQYTPIFKYRKLFKYLKFRPYLFQKSLMLNRFNKPSRFVKKRAFNSFSTINRLLKYKLNIKRNQYIKLMHPSVLMNRMKVSYRLRNYMFNFVRPSFMSFRDNNWRQLQLSVLSKVRKSKGKYKHIIFTKNRDKLKKNNFYNKHDKRYHNMALKKTKVKKNLNKLKSNLPLILKKIALRRKALLFFQIFKKYTSILISNYNLSKVQLQLVYQFVRIILTSVNIRNKISMIKLLIDNNIPMKLIHDCLIVLSLQQYKFYKKVYRRNKLTNKLYTALYCTVRDILMKCEDLTKAQLLLFLSALLRKIKIRLFKLYKNKLLSSTFIKKNPKESSLRKSLLNNKLKRLRRMLNKRAFIIIRLIKRVFMNTLLYKKVN